MKFLSELFNSGTVTQQNKRRIGVLLIAVTAALLAVALVVLMVASIVTAVRNNKDAGKDQEDEEGSILGDPTTTTFAEGQYSKGLLLLIDAEHRYTGSDSPVQPAPNVRPVDENNQVLYKGDYQEVNVMQETLDAFNAMVTDFHAAQKDAEDYAVGGLWLQSFLKPGVELSEDVKALLESGYALILRDQYLDGSIYDPETQTGVGVYQWIYENAHKYGFIRVSEAEGEEDIFRYVGVAHATYIKNTKSVATVAEYLEVLKNKYSYKTPLPIQVKGADGKNVTYRVYYLASGSAMEVPQKYGYTVSGDNLGGYVVTVNTADVKTK